MLLLIINSGCKKFLEEKPSKKLVVITSLQDLQSLMDNYNLINNKDAGAGEASADNYYLLDADWTARTEQDRNMYIWNKDNLFNAFPNDWSYTYDNVYKANTVLENIIKIERNAGNQQQWDDIKGQALFLRAKSFLQMALIFALAYDEVSADKDLGIPLRLTSDFNAPSVRSTVGLTYEQILQDLKSCADLLPATPLHVQRASKTAVYGLLARVYLSMRKYEDCYQYANMSLQLKNNILSFSTLNANAPFPFAPEFSNPEIIYASKLVQPQLLTNTRAKIDPVLYQSYQADDLRKKVFFTNNSNGINTFKGSYTGTALSFTGIATNEVLLMRAECLARRGDKEGALADLNALMSKRWNPATFSLITAASAQEALNKIITERRKELVISGLRWMDIKRLNKEGANISIKRTIAGQDYILLPNDLRYALAIPENVIALSGMPQNPRP